LAVHLFIVHQVQILLTRFCCMMGEVLYFCVGLPPSGRQDKNK
jgi:hypothetical protein